MENRQNQNIWLTMFIEFIIEIQDILKIHQNQIDIPLMPDPGSIQGATALKLIMRLMTSQNHLIATKEEEKFKKQDELAAQEFH